MPSVTLHSKTLVQVWSVCHDHFLFFFFYSFDHCFAHISRLWITMCLDLVKDAKCDVECQRWNCNKVFKLQMHILNKAGWHTHISRHLSFSPFFFHAFKVIFTWPLFLLNYIDVPASVKRRYAQLVHTKVGACYLPVWTVVSLIWRVWRWWNRGNCPVCHSTNVPEVSKKQKRKKWLLYLCQCCLFNVGCASAVACTDRSALILLCCLTRFFFFFSLFIHSEKE